MPDNTKAAELADLMECHAGFARTETGKLLREAAALLRASEGRVPEGLARNDAKDLLRAGVVCHDLGRVSVSAVQRRLAISWNRAEALCGQLIQLRLVDGLDSSSPHLTAEPHPPAQQAEPAGEFADIDAMHREWAIEDRRRVELLEAHLRQVLEVARTWQPDYASVMDRKTLQLAAAEVGHVAHQPPHKAEGAEPRKGGV